MRVQHLTPKSSTNCKITKSSRLLQTIRRLGLSADLDFFAFAIPFALQPSVLFSIAVIDSSPSLLAFRARASARSMYFFLFNSATADSSALVAPFEASD